MNTSLLTYEELRVNGRYEDVQGKMDPAKKGYEGCVSGISPDMVQER